VPLCVVCGGKDAKYVDISREMCDLARTSPHLSPGQVRCHVVPEAGHCVHLEAPQALAPILADFLSSLELEQESK